MTIALEIKQEEQKTITNTRELAEYVIEKSNDIETLPDEKREKLDAQITAKLKAGKKLSQKELAYLRRTNPSMYAHAMRVQKMAEAIEERIKHAKSKQEADSVIISLLNGISKNDPDREYIVAAVNRISDEMHKSSAYSRLPNTDIEAQKSRENTKGISFEGAEDRLPPIETQGLIDSEQTVCYDRSILQPEHRGELLERMLSSMNKAESSEKIVEYDKDLGREIYAFSIYDGKVHVSGNEGFEYKAMTYEKLINASLNKSWNCLFKGLVVDEAELIDKVDGILKYYMDIDNDYKKSNKGDSITNHVNEAFQKWCDDHKQREIHFIGRA